MKIAWVRLRSAKHTCTQGLNPMTLVGLKAQAELACDCVGYHLYASYSEVVLLGGLTYYVHLKIIISGKGVSRF